MPSPVTEKKKEKRKKRHLYLKGLLLSLSFAYLVFPLAPLRASILFFRQSSFYPCSVWCPPVGSAFHHPACSHKTPVALRCPAVSLIAHVTCSRRALASGRGKHVAQWRCGESLPLQDKKKNKKNPKKTHGHQP